MNSTDFEVKMREGECFHHLTLPRETWAIVRCDGRSFSRFTEANFEKPFDPRFRDHMLVTAQALLTDLSGVYAYVESDEVSVLLPPSWSGYGRELEKLVSISAGIASSAFSLSCGLAAQFDARVWLGQDTDNVIDYISWRRSDAARCALNGWCYWTLRGQSISRNAATAQLDRLDETAKVNLLAGYGIDYDAVPMWQRGGIGLLWETYEKEGFDPVRDVAVTAKRRRIATLEELPEGEAYAELLRKVAAPEG